MDALPTLTLDPNSGVPSMLTTYLDPDIIQILFAPMKAAEIMGEVRKGSWIDQTAVFPVVESTGEVASYGDFNEQGRAGVNTNFPQVQSYLFQVIKKYGELELERAGLARINWVSEIDKAAALNLNKFANFVYFFGLAGLQNYGLLNNPFLPATISPGTKVSSAGNKWLTGNIITSTANEIFVDIQALFYQLVSQTNGLVDQETPMVLALSPTSAVGLTATNSFNVNVTDLIKKNFPNVKVVTATQYGLTSTTNPQGQATGNLVQLIAPKLEGQVTGFAAYNEKMRAHPIIRHESSFTQKVTAGVWGMVLRMPMAVAGMLGV
jgi:hypothetical protein